jgi:hypothetical protein
MSGGILSLISRNTKLVRHFIKRETSIAERVYADAFIP